MNINLKFECSAVECLKPALCKGLCNAHYLRMRKGLNMDSPVRIQGKNRKCKIEDCGKKHYGNDYCVNHWRTWNRQNIKLKLIEMMGGKCTVCKNTYHHAAFDFHHLDPSKKKFSITDKIQNLSFEELIKETKKCILLCVNCHRIEHARELI